MSDLPNLDRFQSYVDGESVSFPNPVNDEERTLELTKVEELPLTNDSMNFENPVIELFEELDEYPNEGA